jgi:endonuclease YncB( thermonuclease family)
MGGSRSPDGERKCTLSATDVRYVSGRCQLCYRTTKALNERVASACIRCRCCVQQLQHEKYAEEARPSWSHDRCDSSARGLKAAGLSAGYGRTVATCSVGGADLGDWLVRNGLALDWPQYSKRKYESAQGDAEQAGRGMWAGSYVEPWLFRVCVRASGSPSNCSDDANAHP